MTLNMVLLYSGSEITGAGTSSDSASAGNSTEPPRPSESTVPNAKPSDGANQNQPASSEPLPQI